MKTVTLVPHISEKAVALADRGVYVFEVPRDVNKLQVASAVSDRFKVEVTQVQMMVVKGKTKRFQRTLGRRRDVKKALVSLKKGQSIALFEGGK